MADTKRSTIYFDPKVYRALKIKAAVTDESISDLVNDAVAESLREDAIDIEAARKRAREPRIPYEQVLKGLKRKGLL